MFVWRLDVQASTCTSVVVVSLFPFSEFSPVDTLVSLFNSIKHNFWTFSEFLYVGESADLRPTSSEYL